MVINDVDNGMKSLESVDLIIDLADRWHEGLSSDNVELMLLIFMMLYKYTYLGTLSQ